VGRGNHSVLRKLTEFGTSGPGMAGASPRRVAGPPGRSGMGLFQNVLARHAMPRYVFPGLGVFIERAVQREGRGNSAPAARTNPTLSALANLCAQAEAAGPENARSIMLNAMEFRHQLQIALQAADIMIEEVQQALRLTSHLAPVHSRDRRYPGRPAKRSQADLLEEKSQR
jgi:hypothetical protein